MGTLPTLIRVVPCSLSMTIDNSVSEMGVTMKSFT